MSDATGSELRILMIDDDNVMVDLLSALFEHSGHRVHSCPSGEAALSLLGKPGHRYDVVLTDLKLPGLHGGALGTALRGKLPPATLLLGMSGSRPERSDTEPLDGFLLKPFTTAQFDEAVQRAGPGRNSPAAEPAWSLPDEAADEGGRGVQSEEQVLNPLVYESLRSALDAEQLRQVYRLTIEDTQHRIDKMQASADRGDFEAVRREAHTIRGSAGMVGATELHLLASATEGGAPGSTPAIADFRSACQRLQRMLDETLAH